MERDNFSRNRQIIFNIYIRRNTVSKYVICTDSSCDISPKLLKEWGVLCCEIRFRFEDGKEYTNADMDSRTFYARMRNGEVAKTSAPNVDDFFVMFESVLKEGKDVLYFGLSSVLSATFNSARLAANALAEKYPDRKVILIDTLGASAGIAMMIRLTLDNKSDASVEEAAEYGEHIKSRICYWFTVDDLVYLKRGGRIGSMAAFAGNALGLKPVIHLNDEGQLVNVAKVRGRKTALTSIADKYGELADPEYKGTVYISHADCMKDADDLDDIMREKYGVTVEYITNIGAVIGAHAGPGTLAMFFVGKEK